ncbi:hypothetical protein D9758_000537 [Tetrapyrgos nigripes]|uniref:SMP-LTD domain-containing protein n=1 Tax=Tetrapyrgos nigripes TaxID=182062 RepID=A0A8H5H234_9AGAR|nr:hypothetical protein D9758_000537 [Tetrapyrgos nigripes]
MSFKAILYAYILGGITFIPLLLCGLVAYTIYTSVPVEETELLKKPDHPDLVIEDTSEAAPSSGDFSDVPKTRKGWLTVRRTFEEETFDGSYVTLVRSFLDARSKDPKRSRPKDMWYVVLKGQIMYLYEDEGMTECEAVIQMGDHDVVIYPEDQLDGELFAKRNAICLKPRAPSNGKHMPSVTKEMRLEKENEDVKAEGGPKQQEKENQRLQEVEKARAAVRDQALDSRTPWFIFVRSTVEMEDWFLALVHASHHPALTPPLSTLQGVFFPADMNHLVSTLDEQPDVIPMRWFNALFGRLFYSFYRTRHLEEFIISRLMKKLSKVKRPAMLADVVVTDVSVGDKTPLFSKPMLKELTKEGDASMEVHVQYKGEIRITVEATAIINLGARFKSYTVKLVLAAVLKELEGNLLVKMKRPPSNRLWYAFTQTPRMVLTVEPIVSDRQITWTVILSTIEAKLKEIIQESVVLPNMDDIAFFETKPYLNRGGIYSDAGRHHRERAGASIPAEKLAGTEETSDIRVTSLNDDEPQPMEKPQSLYEAPAVHTSSLSPDTASASSVPLTKSSTLPEDSPANQRRKTWFSSARTEPTATASLTDIKEDQDAPRGRTLEVDNSLLSRSRSTPGQNADLHSSPSPSRSSSPSQKSVKRSVSQHSTQSHSTLSDTESTIVSQSESPIPIAKKPEIPNPPASPTSSFLAQFKSRTGDKQALSNTAKEAMRKWSTNWAGLKQNIASGTNGSGSEEMPDHGSVGPRNRNDSFGSISQRARTSYAEVRAAVAERRSKQASADGSVDDGRTESPPTLPATTSGPSSSTVTTPSIAERTDSTSSHSDHSNGSTRDRPSSPVDTSATPPSQFSPIHVQPQANTMSIPGIHAKNRGEVMSMGYVAPQPQSPPKPENKPKTNINLNPKIQSMYRLFKNTSLSGAEGQSVDGSKSEHDIDDDRDELLDMLPPPQQDNGQSLSSRTDSHVSSSPIASSSTPFPTQPDSGSTSNSSPKARSPSISFSLPMSTSSSSRPPTGPPLPPRPTSISITRPPPSAQIPASPSPRGSGSRGSSSRSISITGALSPSLGLNGLGQSSAASDALKSIVTKDENTRVKRNSLSESPSHQRGSESSSSIGSGENPSPS